MRAALAPDPKKFLTAAYLIFAALSLYLSAARPDLMPLFLSILVFLIFFFKTRLGLFIYSVYLAFEEVILQHISGHFFLFAKYSGDFLLILLLMMVFAKLAIRRYNLSVIKKNPFNTAFITFMILAVLSMIINSVPVLVGMAGLRQLVRYMILYFLMLVICSSEEDWDLKATKRLLKLILVISLIQGVIGYLQLIYGPGSALNNFLSPGKSVYYEGVLVRSGYSTAAMKGLYGTFLTRNIYGLFLKGTILFMLGLYNEAKDQNKKIAYLCGVAFLAPCLFLSYSRMSIFGVIIGSIIIFLFFKRNFKVGGMLILAVVIFAVYAGRYVKSVTATEPGVATLAERVASPFRRAYIRQSLKIERLAVLQQFTPKLIKSKYIYFGLGPGAFGTPIGISLNYFEGYKKIGLNISDPRIRTLVSITCDVGYLTLLAQYGILGLLALMWVFISVFISLRRKYLEEIKDDFLKGYLLGFISYLLIFMLTWIAGVNIEIRQISYYFWMVAALLMSLKKEPATGEVKNA